MLYATESPKLKFRKMRYQKASMKRRVTVHFGDVRVVVPCQNENTTVADVAEAAITRYKKATGKIDSDVRIKRMQCMSDKGILDMDDKLVDVFDEISDQILAIYDEQSPNGSGADDCNISPAPCAPVIGRVRDSVVEIVNLESPPSKGLRVSSSVTNTRTPGTTAATVNPSPASIRSSSADEPHEQPVRSSLRSETSTPTKHRVTLSPDVQKKLVSDEKEARSADARLTRTSARKSRLTDSFFDAKERLEDAREATGSRSAPITVRSNQSRAFIRPALDPENTVITFPDDDLTPMGIEVTGVQDDPSSTNGRLSAVQILRIEPDGRVGMDGRLRVGDNIVEIDSRPIYQMSILRARAYLSELQSRAQPSLTVARPISSFTDPVDPLLRNQPTTSSLPNRPILSALQQANTQHIGHTKTVELKKTPAGFGFTVTGRETAKGERLFYIGTVKPNGVALGHLRAGDRLLKVNGEPTAELTQAEVVDRLKKAAVGERVTFLVSRVVQPEDEEEEEKNSNSSERENRPPTPVTANITKKEGAEEPKVTPSPPISAPTQLGSETEELELVIPLNDTGSAGLGVSLKARVTVRTNGTRQDCGIFIKNVLHGGAAHKDGRLRVNDRIVGIEELRLDGETNATASEAVSRRLKAIGPTAKHVRLFIQRAKAYGGPGIISRPQEVSRVSVDEEGSSRISVIAAESTTSSEEKPSPAECLDSDYGRMDESELANVSDPFSREAPSRKSMSEKRGMGASNDPHHIKLFQDIKHQRQTSAPLSAMTTSLSFHGQSTARSTSQRAAARARSQSVHPRAPAPPKILKMSPAPTPLAPPQQHNSAPAVSEKRRSQSVESITQTSRTTPKSKHVAMPYRGALTSDSFRQATDFYSESVYGQVTSMPSHPHQYAAEPPVLVKQRSTSRDKDKQRRKSLGGLNVMKSFLGFGSGKSREESPSQKTDAKAEEAQRLREEEERRRIREHYERLREKEAEANRQSYPLTPGAVRREAHRLYTPPNYNYPPQTGMSTSVPEYESYDLIDRYHMHCYPAPESPNVTTNGTVGGVTTATYHHRVTYGGHSQPIPYHYAIPSSKSFHGNAASTGGAAHYPPYGDYSANCPPQHVPEKESVRLLSLRQITQAPYVPQPTQQDERRPTSAPATPTTLNLDTHPLSRPNYTPTATNTRQELTSQTRRVSLRARKKARHGGVHSVLIPSRHSVVIPSPTSNDSSFNENCSIINLPSPTPNPSKLRHASHCPQRRSYCDPQTLRTQSQMVTAIDQPSDQQNELNHVFDYCRVWNDWNQRTGGTLPLRRSRSKPRLLLDKQLYTGVTDC
ncbi:hypothetical protein RB195_011984 [Necator americanus]|uniref:PDZ domain-containing protein n=1 Tax=Necator americanus TaxID=51031 RepID=A0ABR1D502_NECAM